jgi:2-hydroxy-6-oxonona-2,4-dienedioate hydrolase
MGAGEGEVEINGGNVVYEFVGPDDGEVVVITPGGRFSKDYGGVHELADALAAGGKRVLLWDRPNCGRSEIQVYGRSESHMRAETLGLLVKELGIDQLVATGGSGGARDTIIFTIMWPELVRKIAVWSIVGGTYSTMALAGAYVMTELQTVRAKGIEGIIELDNGPFSWAAMIRQNPRNADRLRAIGTEEFHRVMTRWLDAFIPKPNEPIPGVPDWEFEKVSCPTLIVRGGWKDYDHPARTSFEVHALIQGSRLIEPPWPEDAWERAVEATNAGEGSLFDPWVLAAPKLLEFIDEQ